MDMSSDTLSLQEAADRLGVHYMTMYRYVRLGLLPAKKVGGSWRVSVADLDEFIAPSDAPVAKGEAPWAERLEARMVAGDVTGAWAVVEAALASGSTPARIYVDVLAPALASVGERWAGGELGIDDEHLASAVASRIIGRLGPRFNRRGRPRGTVVAAMPSGERHGFGLAMLTDVLRGEGYSVLDLGPDTPAQSLVTAMKKVEDLEAVCLSVAYTDALPRLVETIEEVRGVFGADIPIVIGGRAIESLDHAISLGADGWVERATDVGELIAQITKGARTA
jgi:MerR family transcriptional regulator, light-induced transcriptional regulator